MRRASVYLLFILIILAACESTSTQLTASAKPTDGYTVHIDATKHAATKMNLFVHHYCKGLLNGMMQCLLYDSDELNAKLIGVEQIVPNEVWEKFAVAEKQNWHGHVEELTKVELKAPGLSDSEVASLKETLGNTHGKVIVFWDPNREYPDTAPTVTII